MVKPTVKLKHNRLGVVLVNAAEVDALLASGDYARIDEQAVPQPPAPEPAPEPETVEEPEPEAEEDEPEEDAE
jgi:hypothetical protein